MHGPTPRLGKLTPPLVWSLFPFGETHAYSWVNVGKPVSTSPPDDLAPLSEEHQIIWVVFVHFVSVRKDWQSAFFIFVIKQADLTENPNSNPTVAKQWIGLQVSFPNP